MQECRLVSSLISHTCPKLHFPNRSRPVRDILLSDRHFPVLTGSTIPCCQHIPSYTGRYSFCKHLNSLVCHRHPFRALFTMQRYSSRSDGKCRYAGMFRNFTEPSANQRFGHSGKIPPSPLALPPCLAVVLHVKSTPKGSRRHFKDREIVNILTN